MGTEQVETVVKALPNLTCLLDHIAERYVSLTQIHSVDTYDYKARSCYNFPVVEHLRHAEKCKKGETWIYFAVPADASLRNLRFGDRLYVGSQTQDRMFRGDGSKGKNFHHAEMRCGNGEDTLLAYLGQGRQVVIYRVDALRVAELISSDASLAELRVLEQQSSLQRSQRLHLGWWYEQYVLFSEHGQWRWNTAKPSTRVQELFMC